MIPTTQEEVPAQAPVRRSGYDRWLPFIGGVKLLKGIFFVLIGIGVLRLVHRDVADFLMHVVRALHFSAESRLVALLLEQVDVLTPHRLQWIGAAAFLDAGLDFVEGIGLLLRKVWAEYFTLIITASFLPIELYEIIRHVTLLRVGILLINFVVVLYLASILKRRLAEREQHEATGR